MKTLKTIFTLLFGLMSCTSFAQVKVFDYFGQKPPGKTISKFAPGIISLPDRHENAISFSHDGSEMFLTIFIQTTGHNGYFKVKHSERINDIWLPLTDFNETQGFQPRFAPFKRLYWWNPIIKYSTKTDSCWSKMIDTKINGGFISASLDSTLFFVRHGNGNRIYYSNYNGVAHEDPIPLPYPINYTPKFVPDEPSISPDGSYIVFMNNNGTAGSGFYVSFKKENNNWTIPKKLIGGKESFQYISNPDGIRWFGLSAFISPDGKYIFGLGSDGSDGGPDIYWISTEVIEHAGNTNFSPYVNEFKLIKDTSAIVNEEFTFALNDSTFIDDDGNETLTFSAKQSNGEGLPEWLEFESKTHIFSGTPKKSGSYSIKVTATDTTGASIADEFIITI